jgi:hypothetical protein
MSDDALKRARQALEVSGPRRMQPAAHNSAKVDELLARARAAASHSETAQSAPPPPAPEIAESRIEKVRLQMTCGGTGRPFVTIAERRGDALRLVGNEVPQSGSGHSAPAELLSGSYRVEFAPGWACPICRSGETLWTCNCAQFTNALHCGGSGGSRGRARYCACGRLEDRHLVELERIQVRGQSVGATSKSLPARAGAPANVPAIRGR